MGQAYISSTTSINIYRMAFLRTEITLKHIFSCHIPHASFSQLFLQMKPLCIHAERIVISLTCFGWESTQTPSIFLGKVGSSELILHSTFSCHEQANSQGLQTILLHSQRMRKHRQFNNPESAYSSLALASYLCTRAT